MDGSNCAAIPVGRSAVEYGLMVTVLRLWMFNVDPLEDIVGVFAC